jgi:hypothetical protein
MLPDHPTVKNMMPVVASMCLGLVFSVYVMKAGTLSTKKKLAFASAPFLMAYLIGICIGRSIIWENLSSSTVEIVCISALHFFLLIGRPQKQGKRFPRFIVAFAIATVVWLGTYNAFLEGLAAGLFPTWPE